MEEAQKKNNGCGCCLPFVVLVVVCLVGTMLLAIQAYDYVNSPAADTSDGSALSLNTPSIEQAGHVFNILIVGHDQREGQAGQRSDAMILCTFDTVKKNVVMTSFLRDLYVEIPGYGSDRLNAAYSFGGIALLKQTLRQNFGVQVDHTMEISFDQFEDVIELFGGVSIELTKAEADHLGGGLKEGVNLLTAAQTLDYARIRKLDSDFGRTGRQRKVITALLTQMKGMKTEALAGLVERISGMITTDMSAWDIALRGFQVYPVFSAMEIATQHIPAAGTYRNETIDKKAVLVPDLEANIEILKETIGS